MLWFQQWTWLNCRSNHKQWRATVSVSWDYTVTSSWTSRRAGRLTSALHTSLFNSTWFQRLGLLLFHLQKRVEIPLLFFLHTTNQMSGEKYKSRLITQINTGHGKEGAELWGKNRERQRGREQTSLRWSWKFGEWVSLSRWVDENGRAPGSHDAPQQRVTGQTWHGMLAATPRVQLPPALRHTALLSMNLPGGATSLDTHAWDETAHPAVIPAWIGLFPSYWSCALSSFLSRKQS